MILFVHEGRYVTAANKFWFWIAVLAGAAGAAGSFWLLGRADQPVLACIMSALLVGCVIFDCLFLLKGKRSCSITACGYGIAAMVIPAVLQCINLQSDVYISLSAFGMATIIANVWALLSCSKRFSQWSDETVKVCVTLRGKRSRAPMIILYLLAAAGIILALIAVISGTLPMYPD